MFGESPGFDRKQSSVKKKGKTSSNGGNAGDMDMIRKFRYNFNFWLKNCYQPMGMSEERNKEVY